MIELNISQRNLPFFDEAAAEQSRKKWDEVAKPLGGLGLLEEAVTRIIGITADPDFAIDKRAVLVMCADNGVVKQGVTPTDGEVTAILAKGFAENCLTINAMATVARTDVITVDMGMTNPLDIEGIIDRRIDSGTNDISTGPAMTREQAVQAVQAGIDLVKDLKEKNYKIICNGETGIGNTTSASALAAVLLGKEPVEVTGRGVGISDEMLCNKIATVERALEVNKPNAQDPLDILAKLGGFEIAGMCGVCIGGAQNRIPVVVDGITSSVSALCAVRLFPQVQKSLLASHQSVEPAASALLQELHLKPIISAELHVGEGTGAVASLPLLDMGFAVYRKSATYADLGI